MRKKPTDVPHLLELVGTVFHTTTTITISAVTLTVVVTIVTFYAIIPRAVPMTESSDT
jgi:hypothetical protein